MPRRRKSKKINSWDKWFLLSWKKFGLVVLLWVVFVVLHNLVSALLGLEEAVFFILAIFVLPIYFIVMIVYSLVKLARR